MADPNAYLERRGAVRRRRHSAAAPGIQRDFGLIRGTLGGNIDTRDLWRRRTVRRLASCRRRIATHTDRHPHRQDRLRDLAGADPLHRGLRRHVRAYDEERDSSGYARSGDLYAARAGVELDLGEKLRGELGIGFDRQTFDDERLKAINAFAADGRGRLVAPGAAPNVNLGLENLDRTRPPRPAKAATSPTSPAPRSPRTCAAHIVARLTGFLRVARLPDVASASDQNVYIVGTGLGLGFQPLPGAERRRLLRTDDAEERARIPASRAPALDWCCAAEP